MPEKILFSRNIKKLLERLDFSRLGKKVAIKLHFGERGCITYVRPEIVKAVYEKVVSLGKECSLVDSNVLYKGARTTREEHIKVAKEHGFDFGIIEILDGEKGEESLEVEVKGRAGKAMLGSRIKNYDSMVVVTHFKGHGRTGYGGALKNIGMGIGSRAGKLHMHSDIKPSVIKDKCLGCGRCLEGCDFEAIQIINGKAEINSEKCGGCAMCIAVCENEAIKIPWEGSSIKELQEKMIDYVEGVFRVVPKEKIIFINVLEKITTDCDCHNFPQTPIMEDVGILAGYDVVAIEKASLDLVIEKSGGKFDKINKIDKYYQIEYSSKRGLGNKEYELINLD